MPILTPLRSLAVSAVALVVAASTGVAVASVPAPAPATLAVPAVEDATALAEREALERQTLITSRAAEREALDASVLVLAEQRSAALATTSTQIDETSAAVQAQREADRLAAEKAAAEEAAKKAAAEKAAATPQGGTRAQNKELGRHLAQTLYGWGADQFACYDKIIMRESLWDQHADNPTSSAYGIPQALPGKRMASEGADWATNPATQIRWGLKYVKDRYGTPCKAWSFKRAKGWY